MDHQVVETSFFQHIPTLQEKAEFDPLNAARAITSSPFVVTGNNSAWESKITGTAGISRQSYSYSRATPTHALHSQTTTRSSSQAGERLSPVDEIAAQRIKILAKKYAGEADRDLLARLEILNGKLDAVQAQAISDRMSALEEIASHRIQSEEKTRLLEEELGITDL